MDRVTRYRQYAEECLKLAQETSDRAKKRMFLEMASSWHELAVRLAAFHAKEAAAEPPISPQGLLG